MDERDEAQRRIEEAEAALRRMRIRETRAEADRLAAEIDRHLNGADAPPGDTGSALPE